MATFIVNTAEDGDDGDFTQLTLREAVRRANETDGTDTIRFAEGIDFIRLEDGEIDVTDDLVIEGGTGVTISGDADGDDEIEAGSNITDLSQSTTTQLDDNSRIFYATDAQMNLSDLVLTGGRTVGEDEDGGAIYSNDSVIFERVTLAGNETDGDYSTGGGLYAEQAVLIDSTVRDNRTFGDYSGGGGVSAGYLTLSSTEVTGNATYGEDSSGGGLYAESGSIYGSRLAGNFTDGNDADGGGADFEYVRVVDSRISGNATYGEDARGGGIASSNITLLRSQVIDNQTYGEDSRGGGIHSNELAIVNESTISGNAAAGYEAHGGGIDASVLSVFDSTVSNNETTGADGYGGGINAGYLTMIRGTVSGNRTQGDGAAGGGIYANYAYIKDSTIFDNETSGEAADGGGLYIYYDLTLVGSTVSGNSTSGFRADGGGIFSGDNLNITNSTIVDNEATGDESVGGGIFSSTYIALTHSTVTGNRANGTDSITGGLYIDGAARITNSIVLGNSSTGDYQEISSPPTGSGPIFTGLNIVGSSSSDFDASESDNVVNAAASDVFAEVVNGAGVLRDNGGLTQTVLILEGGPAQGTGFGITPITDQRGEDRPGGVAADLGAVELEVPDAPTLTGETIQLAFDDDGIIRIPLSQLTANDDGIAPADLVLTGGSAGRIEGGFLIIDGADAESLASDTTDRDGEDGASVTVSYTVDRLPDQAAAVPAEAVFSMAADLRLAEASLAAEPGETATVDVSTLIRGGFGDVTITTATAPTATDGRGGDIGTVSLDGDILSFVADEDSPTRDAVIELSAVDALGQTSSVEVTVEVETAGGRTLVQGTDARNTLRDTTGDEQLEGLDDRDILIMSGGDDRAFGGQGADFFAFARTGTASTVEVVDYEQGTDLLVFDDQFFGLGTAASAPRALTFGDFVSILATGSVSFSDGTIFIDPDGAGGADPRLALDLGIEQLSDLTLGDVLLA